MSFVEITKKMASDWKTVVTTEEKKKYEAMAAEDHDRFQREMKQFKQEELSFESNGDFSSMPVTPQATSWRKKRKVKDEETVPVSWQPTADESQDEEVVSEKELERRKAATERMRKRRQSMSEEEKIAERKKNALRVRLRRANLSPDQKAREKARNAERQRLARMMKQTSMSPEDLAKHKARLAARKRELRHAKMKDMTESEKQQFHAHQLELQRQRRVKRENDDPPSLDPAAVATAAAAAAATNPALTIQVGESGEILSGEQVAGTIQSLHQHILSLEKQVKELQQQKSVATIGSATSDGGYSLGDDSSNNGQNDQHSRSLDHEQNLDSIASGAGTAPASAGSTARPIPRPRSEPSRLRAGDRRVSFTSPSSTGPVPVLSGFACVVWGVRAPQNPSRAGIVVVMPRSMRGGRRVSDVLEVG